jgi:hypothetical protein
MKFRAFLGFLAIGRLENEGMRAYTYMYQARTHLRGLQVW